MRYWIYDFNGTILDDLDACIWCENQTIKKYLNRAPLTKEEYLNIFCFPVKDYYEKVGFSWDKFNYEEVGDYWYSFYKESSKFYKLHDGVIEVLKRNHNNKDKNICLSASRKDELIRQLKELGIYELFDEVLGTSDIYAYSKIPVALDWIKDKDPNNCLFIGDTLHDKEVADAMKVRCVLVSKGHQAKEKLIKECDDVVDDIREVKW